VLNGQAHARDFKRINIPGAKCGSGTPYSVWVDSKQGQGERKLLIEFMGGGACWSDETCFGKKLRTWIFPIPTVPVISWLSNDIGPESLQGPLRDHSMIYFPYCTGDVHAGRHTAQYGKLTAYHHGYDNVVKALNYLESQGLIRLAQFEEVVLAGSSAGAIGSLIHAPTIGPRLKKDARKIIIADAPGLHFGKNFWNKFDEAIFQDFKTSFLPLGFSLSRHDHLLSKQIPVVAKTLKAWRIGILQGARDIVMSEVFGNISPNHHREQVYGDEGVYRMGLETSNVSVWLPDTLTHTFLLTGATAILEADGMSGKEFVAGLLHNDSLVRVRTW